MSASDPPERHVPFLPLMYQCIECVAKKALVRLLGLPEVFRCDLDLRPASIPLTCTGLDLAQPISATDLWQSQSIFSPYLSFGLLWALEGLHRRCH
jgi:hypothetical protein